MYPILCKRFFKEKLQFRRSLELFQRNNSKNYLWYGMGYIVIFNRLAGIPNVVLLVPPMVHCLDNEDCQCTFLYDTIK